MLKPISRIAVVVVSAAACSDDRPLTVPNPSPGGASSLSAAAGGGAVYTMNNARSGNRVVILRRGADGRLTRAGAVPTGGTGSGSFEDAANGLILGSRRGEASPDNPIQDHELLFATKAGSNSISVFRVHDDGGLELVEVQSSQGEKPVSVTVNRGVLYVLNSGELEHDLFDRNGETIPNCTTGRLPSVTGFRVHASGRLTPIPNSRRRLSSDCFSGCAQVSFDRSGKVLVVTERTAVKPPSANNRLPAGDEGLIVTFRVNDDGTLGVKRLIDATGQGPFGFTFSRSGVLLTTEQFDGPFGPRARRGGGVPHEPERHPHPHQRLGRTTAGPTPVGSCSPTTAGTRTPPASSLTPGSRSIVSAGVDSLRLLDATANTGRVTKGAADLALSLDSKYLYQLDAF